MFSSWALLVRPWPKCNSFSPPTPLVTDPGKTELVIFSTPDTLDLRSFEVILDYDPLLFEFDASYGEGLFGGACMESFGGVVEESASQIRVYCVLLGADCWATGPGEICRFEVTALAPGISQVSIASIDLFAPQTGRIEDLAFADYFIIVRDPSLSDNPQTTLTHGTLLHPCYPNPFNPSTHLSYSLEISTVITLQIFDLRGRKVVTLVDGQRQEPGTHHIAWRGTDQEGRLVPGGTYIYHLMDGETHQTRTMSLIR